MKHIVPVSFVTSSQRDARKAHYLEIVRRYERNVNETLPKVLSESRWPWKLPKVTCSELWPGRWSCTT